MNYLLNNKVYELTTEFTCPQHIPTYNIQINENASAHYIP